MKKNTRKIALFLILFAGISAYSFGESIFTTSIGINRLYEKYPDEDIGRDLDGITLDLTLINFIGKSRFGWYVKTILGTQTGGVEWHGQDIVSIATNSSTDIRLSAGASFALRPGSKIRIPISIGPVVANYREETYYSGYDFFLDGDHYYEYSNVTGYFEALSVGGLADVSIVFIPRKNLALTTGITATYDFLRWEKGSSENSARNVSAGKFEKVKYNSIKVGLYFGVGFKFDNSKSRDKDDD